MRLAHAARNFIFIGSESVFGACLGEFIMSHHIFPDASCFLYGQLTSTFLAMNRMNNNHAAILSRWESASVIAAALVTLRSLRLRTATGDGVGRAAFFDLRVSTISGSESVKLRGIFWDIHHPP